MPAGWAGGRGGGAKLPGDDACRLRLPASVISPHRCRPTLGATRLTTPHPCRSCSRHKGKAFLPTRCASYPPSPQPQGCGGTLAATQLHSPQGRQDHRGTWITMWWWRQGGVRRLAVATMRASQWWQPCIPLDGKPTVAPCGSTPAHPCGESVWWHPCTPLWRCGTLCGSNPVVAALHTLFVASQVFAKMNRGGALDIRVPPNPPPPPSGQECCWRRRGGRWRRLLQF